MNKNVLIVLAGGFIIAVLVAVIVQASFGNKSKAMVEIAIASKPLTAGSEVRADDIQWKAVPESSVFEGSIIRSDDRPVSEELKGRLRRDIGENEPILRTALTQAGRGNVLAVNMEPGMRAIAVKGSADTLVAGFINPGDRVDVILTYNVRVQARHLDEVATKVNRVATETVLENVKVLAIDQTARKEDDKAKVGRTVTLEVTPKGAEKLALASSMGELSLALRGLGDDKLRKTEQRMTTDVEVSSVLQAVNQLKRSTGANPGIVRVYEGDAVENIAVRR